MVSHRVSAGAGRGRHGITCRAIMATLCSLFVLAMTILEFAPEGRAGQAACKPGSVPAVAGGGWPFIWDARYRTPHATYPGDDAKTRLPLRPRRAAPTRSCSRWGLPCRARRRARGALLPHPFTLARLRRGYGGRFAFCGTFPGVAPAGRYPAPCFRGARTFLPPRRGVAARRGRRPSGRLARVP